MILDFQLQEHEKFLSSFTSLFKEVDADNNGILNEQEFSELMQRMSVLHPASQQEVIDALLNLVDPHNNKQMTYSEVVQLLSSQMTPISEDNPRLVPILEKYVNQMQIVSGLEPQMYNDESEEALGQQQWYEEGGYAEQEYNQDLEEVDNNEYIQ